MKAAMFMGCAMLALSAGLASAQTAAPADNDTAIAEIVVTAQKRAENLQDVPVSVTALTSDTLAARGVNNVLALNNMAPGLRISANDAAANPKIYIRGVGLSDFNPNASSGVGVYVDGVYIGSPLAQMAGFFDLAQVEVLRGPQGTLYGRNTNGGAINITTKRPTQTFSVDTSMEYGSFNAITGEAAVGGPLIADKLAFRAAAQVVKDDGYTFNRATGNDVNAADHWAGRLSLLYTPTDDFEMLTQVSRYVNRGDAIQPQHRALFPATAAATGPTACAPPTPMPAVSAPTCWATPTPTTTAARSTPIWKARTRSTCSAPPTRPPGRSAASRWSRSRPGSGRIATTSRTPTAARCRCWRSTIAPASSSSPRNCACSPTTARPR
jgi:iron complex outermembrane receptor protein